MIICPKCNEEIEDGSYYCDQCGQALRYCNRCGRAGLGRRCTNCGGLMVSAEDYEKQSKMNNISSSQVSYNTSSRVMPVNTQVAGEVNIPSGPKKLQLVNSSLDISIEGQNGAVIGRRQGPYSPYFQSNMYVSGVHAQLYYKSGIWTIVDKHSSNGTKLNGHPIQPDVEMTLNDGDVIMIANVNLKVIIS